MTNEEKEIKQGYPLFYMEGIGYTDDEIKAMSLTEVKTLIAHQKVRGDIIEISTIYDKHNIIEYAANIANKI